MSSRMGVLCGPTASFRVVAEGFGGAAPWGFASPPARSRGPRTRTAGGFAPPPKISPWASCAKVFIKTPVGTGGVPWPAGNGKPHHPPPGVRGPGSAERKNGQSQAGPPNNNWKTSDRGVKKKKHFCQVSAPIFGKLPTQLDLGCFFGCFQGSSRLEKGVG